MSILDNGIGVGETCKLCYIRCKTSFESVVNSIGILDFVCNGEFLFRRTPGIIDTH